MSRTIHHATHRISAADAIALLVDGAAGFLATLQRSRAQARTRRILAGLSDEQLHDIGLDRDNVCPSRPSIEVQAGLMDKLMAMR
jgi:uncharacterized protein YjiS (DUF1127 family)